MNEEHIIQLMDLGQITHIAYSPKSPNHCNHHPTFYIAASIASCPSKGNGDGWEDTCSSQNGTSISRACGPLGVQNNPTRETNAPPITTGPRSLYLSE